ncbi:MAG: Asparagine--tRNA ligase [candidate division Hyd24-12 bacterium ADurb.Bin004]|nr:MAG: Asparagine--tRNA ligase [candidate division Hyd24-12 bacterium ADurb.Bin004]
MERLGSQDLPTPVGAAELSAAPEGSRVTVHGAVQRIRRLSWGAFVVLRRHDGLVQCVLQADTDGGAMQRLQEESCVEMTGTIHRASMKDPSIMPRDTEIHVESVRILSEPASPPPVDLTKKILDLHIDTNLDLRPVSLRHPVERARLRIASALEADFRRYLSSRGFTSIRSPKICFAGAEGGANIFRVQYFDRTAFLAQSPQFYKQMAVAFYERVFETGPVFRAEPHQTSRHVNEYTSLDFEMGYISSFRDVMLMEAGLLRSMIETAGRECAYELELLGATLPSVPDSFPCVTLAEAHEIAGAASGRDYSGEPDLGPEEEKLVCEHSSREWGSEFVFVTHYPTSKRPFYTMDDPLTPGFTLSFDLLFRGLEITTGGQRIHDYDMQVAKMRSFGLDPAAFESYLAAHRTGLPPHGGLAIGLERLTARLLDVDNIRLTTMFPRDAKRLTP